MPLKIDAWIDPGWLMLESCGKPQLSFSLLPLWVTWWGLKVIRNSWSMIHSLTRSLITSPAEWMRCRPLISFRVCFNSARKCRLGKHGLNLLDNFVKYERDLLAIREVSYSSPSSLESLIYINSQVDLSFWKMDLWLDCLMILQCWRCLQLLGSVCKQFTLRSRGNDE